VTRFIVRHRHEAERCPAANPYAGAGLLNYLSRPSLRQHGVEVQIEAVVRGEHALYMVVESDDEERVRQFVRPFAIIGTVDMYPAATCAEVVAGGGCEGSLPEYDLVTVHDPAQACQRAIESGLVVRRAHPLNCETSIPALVGSVVVPNAEFYVRNHFEIPKLDSSSWRLNVGGLVERPLSLGLRDLKNMKSGTLVATLECAGNGRSLFEPSIEGEKWDLGAVGTAEWTGVPLAEVLERAGIRAGACELLFRGADRGTLPGQSVPIQFERSLSLDDASRSEILLAYAMNGEPLPIQHGYPLRVIVPGWYAVASVKWLTDIDVIDKPFTGHYQTDSYFYEWNRGARVVREPVALQRVRSLITQPGANYEVQRGELLIRGVAWSGTAPIARVEVRIANGSWQQARLVGEPSRYRWQWWDLNARIDTPGETTIRARATDLAGLSQPEQPEWNRLGYGNNSVQKVRIRVQ